jgi:hypothetical protein
MYPILYLILVHNVLNIWFGKCAGTVDEIATRKQKLEIQKQILLALAASCIQSRQFFASTLREQLFE